MKEKRDVVVLMNNAKLNQSYIKVCAPMVRYSKTQYRSLVKKYGVDLCFTPMIMADSFCQSSKARDNEFSTTTLDTPLIVQFAAKHNSEFMDASKLVYPYADGVDLNCGCPQKWAMKDGYGAALLSSPDVIHSLVRNFKNNLPTDFSLSVKIRLLKDLRKTIELCGQLEKCGVNFLTVHARTPSQKSSEDVNQDALKEICKSIQVPLIANGGIKTLNDADSMYENINCSGIMAASGLLTNPALFSGVNQTPVDCVKDWMDIKNNDRDRITFQCYHHHLVFMLEKVLTKQQKTIFNYLSTFESVDNYLIQNVLTEHNNNEVVLKDEYIVCKYPESIVEKYSKCKVCFKNKHCCACHLVTYDCNGSKGKYFTSYLDYSDCDSEFLNLNIFDET